MVTTFTTNPVARGGTVKDALHRRSWIDLARLVVGLLALGTVLWLISTISLLGALLPVVALLFFMVRGRLSAKPELSVGPDQIRMTIGDETTQISRRLVRQVILQPVAIFRAGKPDGHDVGALLLDEDGAVLLTVRQSAFGRPVLDRLAKALDVPVEVGSESAPDGGYAYYQDIDRRYPEAFDGQGTLAMTRRKIVVGAVTMVLLLGAMILAL